MSPNLFFAFASRIFPLITFILVISSGCTRQSPVPEKGVSFALNQNRKENVDSIVYAIELQLPTGKTQQIRGKEVVTFHLRSAKAPLVLDFTADSSHLISVKVKGSIIDYDFVNEHIVIDSKYLTKGQNSLEIEFIAGDLSLNRSDDYLYTLFVPDRASSCFPLFDQPNLKARYSLTLKTPQSWEAVSNGRIKSKVVEGENMVYQFEQTQPISSYLFAFAAGKFFSETKTVDGRTMTMYYRETDSIKVTRNRDEVFGLHARSLEWLENYTQIDYPFGKFDFVLIPSFQYGGMEHPGAVFYNESSLFLDESASLNKKLARASVIAHESAHMWFGDLVTMDWFNDVWLKEVFANFMAAKIVNPSFPEINHDLRFLLAHYPAAYEVDRSRGTNPVLQDLGNLKNAGTLYGAIIYQKAPIVMRQLERKIGEGMLQKSLREYLATYSFGNAKWDDLIEIVDKNSPLDIASWSDVWVKTSGMPVYHFARKGGGIEAGQEADSISKRIWQQSVAVEWKGSASGQNSILNFTEAKPVLLGLDEKALLFPNKDGAGYGYFQMDSASITYFLKHYDNQADSTFSNPLFRGAMLVNQWEGFVRGEGSNPAQFVAGIAGLLVREQNPLLVDYLLSNLQTSWWRFLSDQQRDVHQDKMEQLIWNLLNQTTDKGLKASYFRAFKNFSGTPDALQKLEDLWTGKLVIKDLVLAEDDHISIAYELALKATGDPKIVLDKQLAQTKNPDRKAKMAFVVPALSRIESERDAFFESLKKEENREKEAWVLEALGYLHHPLRQKSALKYLRPSLDILQEIQLTGDIFFPTRWMNTTFSGHSGKEAMDIANQFFAANPDYPYYLKNKIFQATDMLGRAVRMKQ